MSYWIDLFTGTTWEEFQRAGSRITGFRRSMRNQASKVKPGDIFLCYLTGVKRWVGALEVGGRSDDRTPEAGRVSRLERKIEDLEAGNIDTLP